MTSTATSGCGTVIVTSRPLRNVSRTVGPLATVQDVRFGVHQNPHDTFHHERSITSARSISSGR